MTPAEFKAIRYRLARVWALSPPSKPVTLSELGRILKLHGSNVKESVRHYERGQTEISGPLEIAMLALDAGYEPPWLDAALAGGASEDSDD